MIPHVCNFYSNMQTRDVICSSPVVFLTCFTNSMSKRFVVFNVNYISYFCVFYTCPWLFTTNTYSNYNATDNCFAFRYSTWTIFRWAHSSYWLFIPDNGVLNHHALRPCFVTACLCLPWPLTFYYLSHTDTSHLHWPASGLAPLLSPIPVVVTPNTALQGSVPIYNGGVSSSCIVAVCQHFLLSFTDLFSTSCLRGGPVVIPRVVW